MVRLRQKIGRLVVRSVGQVLWAGDGLPAGQFAAGDGQVPRTGGDAAQDQRIEIGTEGHAVAVDADMRAGDQNDALFFHQLQAPVQHRFFQFEIRDAIAQEPAGPGVLFGDRYWTRYRRCIIFPIQPDTLVYERSDASMTGKRRDLLNMLCDLSDLSALVTGSENSEHFLHRTVALVSGNLGTSVCSIYLYDEMAEELVLKATVGLNPEAAGGFALARTRIWGKSHGLLVAETDASDGGTMADFLRAVKRTGEQLNALQQRCAERLPESAALIFAAHFMMLKDPKFIDRMQALIEKGTPATRAVRHVAHHYLALFADSSHAYIREKVNDIEDLAGRLLTNLAPPSPDGNQDSRGRVVVARALYTSELLKLAAESVAGIVLANGGLTSHVAIIARSLKIPMGVVQCPELMHLPETTPLLVDGEVGIVYVDPSPDIIARFEARNRTGEQVAAQKASIHAGIAHTLDGTQIDLLANINLLGELIAIVPDAFYLSGVDSPLPAGIDSDGIAVVAVCIG